MSLGKIIRIRLSPLFTKLFQSETHLVSATQRILDMYSEWLSFSAIPFFPEYTDHGVQHISSVIETAEELLSQEARDLLTPSEAAVFVMAVVLHDIGMHLTQDGFVRLVQGNTKLRPIEAFGDRSWPVLWDEFRHEALRFSFEQNVELFGNPQPVMPPSLSEKDWTKNQFMLVGEFIRRYHSQLSHQIALRGFPGKDAEEFVLDTLLIPVERDLVGLIARSHGIGLRLCVDYLEDTFFNRIDPLEVRAVFLMSLIRTADYFQLDASRSSFGLGIQSVHSSRSLREHNKHQAVIQLTRDEKDSESFRIIIDPRKVESVRVYLDLKNLLEAIQHSLDASWAILGEVFSRQTNNQANKLGMSVRRIRSNLDAPQFLKQIGFIPVHLRFTASESRLFKLLLQPLYGKDPDIGVRELVQNAIDAVRERKVYETKHSLPILPDGDDVVVDVETEADGNRYVTIKDRGIGMSLEVIRDYFLKVGSSLRQSSFWKREFTDEHRRSSVLRTGYFGIGALAAFLVGDEIEVVTRHISSPQGLSFKATIDADPIQIKKVNAEIGTLIRIQQRQSDRVWSPSLRYFLTSPRVVVMGQPMSEVYPDVSDAIDPSWQEISTVKHPVIRWARPTKVFTNRVTLNGFQIEHGDQNFRVLWSSRSYGLRILCPHLHILDYEGGREENNYINLARNTFFQDQFEPVRSVYEDLLRDALGFLLAVPAKVLYRTPDDGLTGRHHWWNYSLIDLQLTELKSGFSQTVAHGSFWAFTSKGLVPCDGSVFNELGIKTIIFTGHWHPSLIPRADDIALILVYGSYDELPALGHGPTDFPPLSLNIRSAVCICIDPNGRETMRAATRVQTDDLMFQIQEVAAKLALLRVEKEAFIGAWSIGNAVEDRHGSSAASLARNLLNAFDSGGDGVSPLVDAWKRCLGTWLVPYDEVARVTKFPDAFKELAAHINAWQTLNS